MVSAASVRLDGSLMARLVGNDGFMGQSCQSVWTEACRIRPPEPISNFIYMEKGGENGKSF